MRFSERMPEQIGIRLSHEERRRIEAVARARGVSISTLVREVVIETALRAAA